MPLSIIYFRERIQLINFKYHRNTTKNCISYDNILGSLSYRLIKMFE